MPKLTSLRWRLALSYAAIALLVALALGLVLRAILQNYYGSQEKQYLQSRAAQISLIAAQLLEANIPATVLEEQVQAWSYILQARIQLEDAAGKLLADSGVPENPQVVFTTQGLSFEPGMLAPVPATQIFTAPMNIGPKVDVFQQYLPEGQAPLEALYVGSDGVQVALPADNTVYGLIDPAPNLSARRSAEVAEQTVQNSFGQTLGQVRLSDGPAYGAEILDNVMGGWIVASAVALLCAVLAGWLVSQRITTPLTELASVTAQMAGGDLSARTRVHSRDEIGALAHSFNVMAARVEGTVGTLRSFVADAAHELNTPLTALQTNVELAAEATETERGELLARAHAQVARLQSLVTGLLNLSRLEGKEAATTKDEVDLTALAHAVAEPYASRAEQAGLIFELATPAQPVFTLGNAAQLRRALENLLDNAVKFTPAGGLVRLGVGVENQQAELRVEDSGIGIPAEDQPALFQRFHRGRNVAHYPGHGLGLAIVQAIVNAHNGQVRLVATEHGASFIITLPVLESAS